MVVLPEPEGPTIAANEEGEMVRERLVRIGVCGRDGYVKETEEREMLWPLVVVAEERLEDWSAVFSMSSSPESVVVESEIGLESFLVEPKSRRFRILPTAALARLTSGASVNI